MCVRCACLHPLYVVAYPHAHAYIWFGSMQAFVKSPHCAHKLTRKAPESRMFWLTDVLVDRACAYARMSSHVRTDNLNTQEEAKKGANAEVSLKETEIQKLQGELAAVKVFVRVLTISDVQDTRMCGVYVLLLPSSVSS